MRGVVGDKAGKKGRGGGAEDAMLGEADSRGYRRALPGFSTNAPRRSANDRPPQSFSDGPGLGGAMDISLPESDTRRLPDLGIALKSILAFWLLYMGADHAARDPRRLPRFLGDVRAARRRRCWSARR